MEIAMRVPTVRVKSDSSPNGFVVINESDLTPTHELWPEQGEAFERSAPQTEQAVAFRCMAHLVSARNDKTIEQWLAQPGVARLEQLQAAEAEIKSSAADTIDGDVSDETKSLSEWRGAHWKTQVKLAKSLGFEGEPSAEQAKTFLAEKLG
jgi:hypothetical protein